MFLERPQLTLLVMNHIFEDLGENNGIHFEFKPILSNSLGFLEWLCNQRLPQGLSELLATVSTVKIGLHC